MTDAEKVEILLKALQDIGQIAVPPDDNPMHALQAAQEIAEQARMDVGDVTY